MTPREFAPDDVRAHLQRVMASAGFHNADSIRRLLEFTVEQTLAGSSARIKEYTLGLEVFGRKEAFDPRTDSIVRVQARKLRERLLAYYESEGAHETIRIEYFKGSYVPRILSALSPEATQPRSIAVIPFVNLGPGSDNEYLCCGITEELIFHLSRVGKLRVVSRSSSMALREFPGDIRSLGQKLNAELIVEGTLRQTGDSLRITAQLINTEDGYHLCSGRWDRPASDLPAVQDEIATAIVKTLRPHLSLTATNSETLDREAHHLYLKGRHFWNQRTDHGFARAVEYYEAAIRRDRRFARAWSSLAETYILMAAHDLEPPDVCMRMARDAVRSALSLDPELAPAHSALATILATFDRDPEQGEPAWERALALDPNYAYAWHSLAVFGYALGHLGTTDQALAALRKAERLEPLSAAIACDFGFLFYFARRYAEAVEASQRALDLHPFFCRTYIPLSRAYAAQGHYDRAIQICLEARPLFRGRAYLGQLLATLGHSYGRIGQYDKAAEVLADLRQLSLGHYVCACDIAAIQAGMGRFDDAMESLRMAVEQRAFWLIALPADALFDPLRADPRFERCSLARAKAR